MQFSHNITQRAGLDFLLNNTPVPVLTNQTYPGTRNDNTGSAINVGSSSTLPKYPTENEYGFATMDHGSVAAPEILIVNDGTDMRQKGEDHRQSLEIEKEEKDTLTQNSPQKDYGFA